MSLGTLDPLAFRAILPELFIFVLGVIALTIDLIIPDRRLGYVTAFGLLIAMLLSMLFGLPTGEPQQVWGGMVRYDGMGFAFKMLFMFAAAMTAFFAMDFPTLEE
ncbi:MAG TPA: hypothetical protein VLS48_04615, partial [Anaerolineales bacterium]|nr:hypothetical protein [Anaerolineales bacterium]